jgi:hypothetical protein
MRYPLFSITCAAMIAAVSAGSCHATCGPDHMAVVGSVTAVTSDHTFTVKRKHGSGKKATVVIRTSSATRYINADRSTGAFTELTPGSSVQVSGTRYVDQSLGAEKILITAVKTP